MSGLSHIKQTGEVNMVDVTGKKVTSREAVAKTTVTMSRETLREVVSGNAKKGNVIATAKIAAINAAKKTHELIPLCHQINVSHVEVEIKVDEDTPGLDVVASVKTKGETGVEMEALTAVSVAALTIYDMVKAIQKDIVIGPTMLTKKTGGKSGEWKK